MTGVVVVAPTRVRVRVTVSGLVQGVGFRPFVYVTASALGLTGRVANTPAGVLAEVEGDTVAVTEFRRRLVAEAPPLAVVEAVEHGEVPARGGTGFTIEATTDGEGRTLASPDVATCSDCLAELADPGDRRHRHPFITCTNCGPRFTIITRLPYDRAGTTMADFAMCAACRAEYDDPTDRRFHAQPIACHDCGPTLELVVGGDLRSGEGALRGARDLLAAGCIVAVKGLGGYHLACDAGNGAAVAELRRRKRRGDKPFAVMTRDLAAAERLVRATGPERRLLTGGRRPIVLLPRREGAAVAAAVAPGHPLLGLMLPYTPLHVLLLEEPGPRSLVMTSGNRSGEPIVTDDQDALDRLASLADGWLRHDRRIEVPCDDSVARFVAGAELPLRRSRGHAPLPVALPFDVSPVLATGGDLKNTCAVASGRYAWLSQHVGDLDDLATQDALASSVAHLEELTGVDPGLVVTDAHPGYRAHRWARERAGDRPLRTVQHHHAHVASVMGEHGLAGGEEVIGVAFDGTGYGDDGAVWGGEVLVAGYGSYRRAAHLRYVPLAGGDASVRRPYRMALAHLWAAGVAWDDDLPAVGVCPVTERGVLRHQLETGFGAVPTSSMGRLFDAVSSLVGVRHTVDYEAEAAIELEVLAAGAAGAPDPVPTAYSFEVTGDEPLVADPAPVVRAVVADVRAGTAPDLIAARFHAAVADLVVRLAVHERTRSGLRTVALAGGVFQNAVLLESAERLLAGRGFTVLRPRLLPPHDGGLALGQILVGSRVRPRQ
ncbi:carbamoyltransferase HypF [Nocardioides donggukensis]|uniref:Carbamoyltransferase n=1 Tax=Nocardioides donggukensis TaxID=2774019 RepID=A0A927Q0Y0_9ACTN|nr:carbamoyltransferase HypF [Nocardioides donggukensis]MBD8869447.1 carbamoyltransferase HypF [Nocardioides donggukensis]